VIVKSIQWRLQFNKAAGAAPSDDVYFWIVQDTQANGTLAGGTEIWQATGNAGTALRNLSNHNRFKVLYKEKVPLVSEAGETPNFSSVTECTEGFLKCNIPVEFDGPTGGIAEIRSNNILLCAGTVLTDDYVTMNGQTRIRFTDQ